MDQTWQQCLAEHPLLLPSAFRSSGPTCITQHEGDLFVWRNEEKDLCFVNVKRIQAHLQGGSGKDDGALRDYQILLCSQTPQFQVKSLKFSPSGHFLALLGEKQVMVLQLPGTRAHLGRFGDGKQKVSCRSFLIAERLLSASSHVDLLQFRWHPASVSESHILILTSDNIIRLFSFAKPQKSLQTYAVAPYGSSFQDSSKSNLYDTTRAISMANTESVVDFDVLPDRCMRMPCPAPRATSHGVAGDEQQQQCCGVFALMDSGDVYMFQCVLPSSTGVLCQNERPAVLGPLRMVPPAEDNYGVDSCSVCCLDSHPPGLVVATAAGRIYHCVVMPGQDAADDSADDSVQGSWARSAAQDDEPVLCVFDGVALALADDSVQDERESSVSSAGAATSQVALHHVSDATDRYLCTHSSGVHCVSLPWLRRLDRFCVEEEGAAADSSVDELNIKEACHIESLISSRPFKDSATCHLASFCAVNHAYLGHTLVCLMDDGVCSTVDMRGPTTVALATSDELTETTGRAIHSGSAQSSMPSSPFVEEIRQILAERSTLPVLRLPSSSSAQLSDKTCSELLDKTMDAFSAQIPVMRKVAAAIAKRTKALERQKAHQLRECEALVHSLSEQRTNQEDLDQQSLTLLEKHKDLTQRLFALFHALEFQAPVRSVAEEQMAENLQRQAADLKKTKQLLDMVRQKSDYHKAGMSQKAPELNEDHQKTIRSLLKQDTDDIEQLVSSVKSLQLQVS
ncbi:nucleoporin 88-like [Sycon ciliatum]|uniref:nucleoporin 88-like n=1 Tax=Sycon ciliatum TaxID=27933 RepID=UPI0031F6081F